MWRPNVFDPILIVAQIVAIQTLFYLILGVGCLVSDAIGGASISAWALFSHEAYSFNSVADALAVLSFMLTSLLVAWTFPFIVERKRKCLDFAATFHIINFFLSWIVGGFPNNWAWWSMTITSLIGMAVLSEYLCVQKEMVEIPRGSLLNEIENMEAEDGGL